VTDYFAPPVNSYSSQTAAFASRCSAVYCPMRRLAYLFERFPSFGQTFCYREVAELERQIGPVSLFSIRTPVDEPLQNWDSDIVRRVDYLPAEGPLVKEIDRAARAGELPGEAVRTLKEWGRQPDFLRLYQATYVGLRLRKQGVERLHAHFAGMAARTAYWISKFFGIPFSFTAHANDIFAPRDFAVSLPKLLEEAVAIVSVSDFAVEHLGKRFPHARPKLHRVYNGIDLAAFRPSDFAAPVPLIVSIGRLIEKKGFADLISACRIVKAKGRDLRCEIIGEGPLERTLAAQIVEAGLQQGVQLVGPKTQVAIAERLATANLFVLACTTEAEGGMDNLPTVIMEAMAAGLPVISTSLAGVPEMVEPGVTGNLVPPGDSAALAEAIDALLSDPAAARALGAKGRDLAATRFSAEANVRALVAILSMR